MARTNAVNFSGGLQFPMASAATDLFKKEDVQTLALAVDGHDHTSGKGLILSASAIPDGSITSAKIADGTLTSTDLAGGAATFFVGGYQGIASFASSSTGTWVATPIAVSGAFSAISGAILVLWATTVFGASGGPGTYARTAILMDGTPLSGSLGLYMIPAAGIAMTVSMHATYQPTAGNHTWAIGVQNNNAGTISTDGATISSLIVMEFRR